MTQNVMSGYYGQPYQQSVDPAREMDSLLEQDMMPDVEQEMVDAPMTIDQGQTLDQIISQNDRELERQRSTYDPSYPPDGGEPAQSHPRRSSMLPANRPQFNFGSIASQNTMPSQMSDMLPDQKPTVPQRIQPRQRLGLDTRFDQMNPGFGTLADYTPAMIASNPLDLEPGPYLSSNMEVPVAFENAAPPPTQQTAVNMQPQMEGSPLYTTPVSRNQPFSPIFHNVGHDSPASQGQTIDQSLMDRVSQMRMPDTMQTMPAVSNRRETPRSFISTARGPNLDMNTSTPQQAPLSGRPNLVEAGIGDMEVANDGSGLGATNNGQGRAPHPQFAGIYAPSGFDMLAVLAGVAARPNPEINIGAVDLSCAFVVCDMTQPDLPIAYCSDNFERLTGYSNMEIVGRNCRFLQSPDGKVQSGERRKYVDGNSVFALKNKISRREEIQLSLINYRKGGQPFNNLLTMIPVSGDSLACKYYVGFQVDLVEQPGSVAGRNPDGTYAINYQRNQLPPYVLKGPEASMMMQGEMSQTIGRDEVTAVLSTIGSGESELSKRTWDKILLENVDDVVHVLSLKGLFLYLSPASRKVLEYDASELVGTALSSVCHPSDIVPVTRELKDTSSGTPVSVVFRIRRKHSGYTWFESHGCLHTEQGKGRKCIIMVGRERPVYAVQRSEVVAGGGIGDSELWTKMSTSGMFLFVSSNSRTLLDRAPADLVGTSAQAMMRSDSKKEFVRVLELARTGKKCQTFKHEMQNRRGQVLQAQTTIYPGDADEGSKPTFLIAQTRFVKMPRSMLLANRPSMTSPTRPDQVVAAASTAPTVAAVATTDSATPSTSGSGSGSAGQGPGPNAGDNSLQTSSGLGLNIGNQAEALASEDNIFDELKTTRNTSWQFELRQMEKQNRILVEELQSLLSRKKKRKRRKGGPGQMEKDCANCHTRVTPEWRRGPSGRRDLCNSCGLRWAKQNGRVSPRKISGDQSEKASNSPSHSSPPDGADGTSVTPQPKAGSDSGAVAASMSNRIPKLETATSAGSLPPKIEEEAEPPHTEVLPS